MKERRKEYIFLRSKKNICSGFPKTYCCRLMHVLSLSLPLLSLPTHPYRYFTLYQSFRYILKTSPIDQEGIPRRENCKLRIRTTGVVNDFYTSTLKLLFVRDSGRKLRGSEPRGDMARELQSGLAERGQKR